VGDGVLAPQPLIDHPTFRHTAHPPWLTLLMGLRCEDVAVNWVSCLLAAELTGCRFECQLTHR
jgi:hypothetical protein